LIYVKGRRGKSKASDEGGRDFKMEKKERGGRDVQRGKLKAIP
jgi:hypothetical protein